MNVYGNRDGEKNLVLVAAGSKAEAAGTYRAQSDTRRRYDDAAWFKVPRAYAEGEEPFIISEDPAYGE